MQFIFTPSMLKIRNVKKTFGEIEALSDVSFDISDGEFVFVIGPSGSGKTTLIRLILREILPDSGEIIFEDRNITKLAPKEIPKYRQKIGVVFQDYKILPERTLKENLEVALAVINVNSKEWKSRVENVLDLVGLSERANLFPSQLSGGEIQRASLARALVVNPKLILADEPTGNLDWDTADGIMELFEKINKEGKTIVTATHNRQIVDKLGKRVIELVEGKVVSKEKLLEEKEAKEEKPKKMKVKVEEI